MSDEEVDDDHSVIDYAKRLIQITPEELENFNPNNAPSRNRGDHGNGSGNGNGNGWREDWKYTPKGN